MTSGLSAEPHTVPRPASVLPSRARLWPLTREIPGRFPAVSHTIAYGCPDQVLRRDDHGAAEMIMVYTRARVRGEVHFPERGDARTLP